MELNQEKIKQMIMENTLKETKKATAQVLTNKFNSLHYSYLENFAPLEIKQIIRQCNNNIQIYKNADLNKTARNQKIQEQIQKTKITLNDYFSKLKKENESLHKMAKERYAKKSQSDV